MGEASTGSKRCRNGRANAVRVQAGGNPLDGTKPCARCLRSLPKTIACVSVLLLCFFICLNFPVVLYNICDAGSLTRSFGSDNKSKLKILSLKVDSSITVLLATLNVATNIFIRSTTTVTQALGPMSPRKHNKPNY